jgi:glyoxalase family protein
MKLEGIHHITAITGDAVGNVEFYTGLLGLRMVKKSVNQDDPTSTTCSTATTTAPRGWT